MSDEIKWVDIGDGHIAGDHSTAIVELFVAASYCVPINVRSKDVTRAVAKTDWLFEATATSLDEAKQIATIVVRSHSEMRKRIVEVIG